MPTRAHSVCLPLPGPWLQRVGGAAALYRPRQPECTTFYTLLEERLEEYLRVHSERFEPRHGALRRVVRRVGEAFPDCGRFHGGFARLRCGTCEAEHLIAFSCQTRNFCPSCQAKRAALFGEFLTQRVLLPVPHRHVVFTVPKALRGLFEPDRRLLGILARSAHDATRCVFQRESPPSRSALTRGLGGSSSHWGKSPFSPKPPRPAHPRDRDCGISRARRGLPSPRQR